MSSTAHPMRAGHRHGMPRHGMPARLLAVTLATAILASVAAGGLALRGSAAAQTAQPDAVAARVGRFQPQATQAAAAAESQPVAAAPRSPAAAGTPVQPAATAVADTPAPPGQATAESDSSSPSTATTAAAAGSAPAPAVAAAVATRESLRGSSALSAAPPPLEREHKVAAGETLSAIAQQYGVSTDTLVVNNAGVTDRDLLKVGQTVRVPPHDGLLYEVRLGESLQMIASRFGVEPSAILSEPANRLTSPDLVRQGQVLLVPGAKFAPPPPPTAVAVVRATATAAPPTPNAPAATQQTAAPAARAAGGWQWPITGPLSSVFGPSHPLGIDVDLYGRAGAPVVAARGGVVTFAGGNPCCSYGYYVELDHGDGFRTLYAHFQAPPPVRIGQAVSPGQVVGYAGTTGYSTGVHLHFEIRKAGVPVNPLGFLP